MIIKVNIGEAYKKDDLKILCNGCIGFVPERKLLSQSSADVLVL